MATKATTLFPPPIPRGANAPDWLVKYLTTFQLLHPLREIDTTDGPYAEDAPPAGLNTTTGVSNQNQEIIYIKISADANAFTLNGVEFGVITLTTQGERARIKSNGTTWYRVD